MKGYEDFYRITGTTQHSEFETFLKDILLKLEERNAFYKKLIEVNHHMEVDTFKPYFELYSAERKSNKQDYTPDEVARLLAIITRTVGTAKEKGKYSGADCTAGTGSLLIQKWWDDMIHETPWSYVPHRYFYYAEELADNAMPYLIHNLAMRGMNAIVIHGDVLERKAKQVYFIQNSQDDYMHFSDVNVMPHTKAVEQEFDIREWKAEPIDHIESKTVKWQRALPSKREALKIDYSHEATYTKEGSNQLKLKDIAEVERAKTKKVYPKGTIVIQMSATRGQIGLLTSSGEVGSQYACVLPTPIAESNFLWEMLKLKAPRHFHRVQEGLNLKLEDIQDIPVALPLPSIQIDQGMIDSIMQQIKDSTVPKPNINWESMDREQMNLDI